MLPKTIVHLLSGGLDSVTLLHQLVDDGHRVHCVLFDYHQKHVQELLFAKKHIHKLDLLYTTIQIPALLGSELTDGNGGFVVPFRNPIMLSLAVNVAVAAKAETITIGCNRDDYEEFLDCRSDFIDAMNKLIGSCGYNVTVCAPYIGKRKWEIAAIAKEMGITTSDVWSCYRGGGNPCGECAACKKLNAAMFIDKIIGDIHDRTPTQ